MPTAAELMNPTLVALHESDAVGFAIDYLQNMGLHAAPVLDSDRRPVGVATLADLKGHPMADPVGPICRGPVLGVSWDTELQDLAEACYDTGLHHLVVTEGEVAIGMLSVLDVLGGLLGREPIHAPMLQVFAGTAQLDDQWSPVDWLTRANVAEVPPGPGFLLIRAGGDTEPLRLLRAARAHDLRAALQDFLDNPPGIAVWADHWGPARFQYRLT